MTATNSDNPQREPTIIVSGLPRSGTSLAMQMLHAGGVPVLTDSLRAADTDNPRGYLEFERVKQIKTDKSWLDDAAGKAVKIVGEAESEASREMTEARAEADRIRTDAQARATRAPASSLAVA